MYWPPLRLRVCGGLSCCQGEEEEMGGVPGEHVGGYKVIGVQSSGALYIIKLLLREGVGRSLWSLNGLFEHGGGVIERRRNL